MSSALDGKDGNGLQLEKFRPIFSRKNRIKLIEALFYVNFSPFYFFAPNCLNFCMGPSVHSKNVTLRFVFSDLH